MGGTEKWGPREVSQAQILQGMAGFMMARAGSGDRPGQTYVLERPSLPPFGEPLS